MTHKNRWDQPEARRPGGPALAPSMPVNLAAALPMRKPNCKVAEIAKSHRWDQNQTRHSSRFSGQHLSHTSTNVLKLVASGFIHVLQHQARTNHKLEEEEERLLIQRRRGLTYTDIHLSFSLHSSSELSSVLKDVGWRQHTRKGGAMLERRAAQL